MIIGNSYHLAFINKHQLHIILYAESTTPIPRLFVKIYSIISASIRFQTGIFFYFI